MGCLCFLRNASVGMGGDAVCAALGCVAGPMARFAGDCFFSLTAGGLAAVEALCGFCCKGGAIVEALNWTLMVRAFIVVVR